MSVGRPVPVAVGEKERVAPSDDHTAAKSGSCDSVSSGLSALIWALPREGR
jgi:hypothetical protein